MGVIMSWAKWELEVIRGAEKSGYIPGKLPTIPLLLAESHLDVLTVSQSSGEYVSQDITEIRVGRVLIDLIVYCALKNTDAARCLEMAYKAAKHDIDRARL